MVSLNHQMQDIYTKMLQKTILKKVLGSVSLNPETPPAS